MSKDIVNSVNKISANINERDEAIWENEAIAKCYSSMIDKLDEDILRFKKRCAEVNQENSLVILKIEELDYCIGVQKTCFDISTHSLLNQSLYKTCLRDNFNRHCQKVESLVDGTNCAYREIEGNFQNSNPLYQEYKLIVDKIKLVRIRNLDLQQKITNLKRICEQKKIIKQQLFYADIVTFAKNWLRAKKSSEILEQLRTSKKEETKCIKELIELQDFIKKKTRNSNILNSKTVQMPIIKFSDNDQFNQYLFDVRNEGSSENDKPICEQNKLDLTTFGTKKEFNKGNAKVKILEEKIFHPPIVPDQITSQIKINKKPNIHKKLQLFAKKVSERKLWSQNSNLSQRSKSDEDDVMNVTRESLMEFEPTAHPSQVTEALEVNTRHSQELFSQSSISESKHISSLVQNELNQTNKQSSALKDTVIDGHGNSGNPKFYLPVMDKEDCPEKQDNTKFASDFSDGPGGQEKFVRFRLTDSPKRSSPLDPSDIPSMFKSNAVFSPFFEKNDKELSGSEKQKSNINNSFANLSADANLFSDTLGTDCDTGFQSPKFSDEDIPKGGPASPENSNIFSGKPFSFEFSKPSFSLFKKN